ncbi:MAG: hypothetical protein DWQ07_23075 [Chloroflexi bacterium]|nr:MAG: hypothetical protein DWQ07_23075 [Chloroflexota bacterium]MBL1194032.1 hypothetical protein [Chloroflexota bacterium]NOH11326.1 hypothetical protein [Chloroflexota bacterium]
MYKKKLIISVFAMTLTALACGPLDLARDILGNLPTSTPTPGISEERESSLWYVATDGDDSNSCAFIDDPCLTVQEAVSRSDDDDQIFIAAGTYPETGFREGSSALGIDYNLIITGAGRDSTFIDGGGLYGVFYASGDARVRIEDLTVQNASGNSPGSGIEIRGNADVIVEDVNVVDSIGNGIRSSSSGLVTLINVNVTGTTQLEGSFGAGVSGGNLDIQGGEVANNYMSGVSSAGLLAMNGTIVRDNGTYGVYSSGTANLTGVDISGHGNILSMNHPGLWIDGGLATLTNTDVFENEEGIVLSDDAILTMNGGNVYSNPRTGILIDETSEATLEEVTVRDNASFYAGTSLGGGIGSRGWLRVYSSLIENNHNGGILNQTETGDLVVLDSTIRANDGGNAGIYNGTLARAYINRSLIADNELDGIENRGDMTMLNSTSTGNTNSGIIAVDGDLAMRFVTLARNGESGLSAFRGGNTVSLVRSILAAENGLDDCNISSGPSAIPFPLQGTNVDSDATCGFPETFTPAELRIGPLADNGGETWTLALDPDSEAVDIVVGSCLGEDQRTFGRPVGASCDAGAYETGASLLTLEDPDIVIGTPTPGGPSTVTIITTTPCYNGPGPQYGLVSNLASGVSTQLIGAGFTGNGNQDWLVASHPNVANTNCWLDSDDVTPSIPFSEMRLITVPQPPTPTPKPTSDRPAPEDTPIPCYLNQQQQVICP